MADLSTICAALADALETIPDLNVYPTYEQITTPAVVVEPALVDFTGAMQRGHEKWEITLRYLTSSASEAAGHLDRFRFFGGVFDIKQAVESHVPLLDGTAAHDVFVRQGAGFGVWDLNGIPYIGGEITVDVYA